MSMTIKDFINEFNLASTMTTKDGYEWTNVLNNNIYKEIDYSNSISLYQLVNSFNELYLKFKKECVNLPSLGINRKDIVGIFYNYYFDDKNNYRRLVMLVNNYDDKRYLDGDAILYLCEEKGEFKSYLTNGLFPFEDNFVKKYLSLSDDEIKKYLDFGSKYDVLIDSFNYFRNKQIFGNGTAMLHSKINGELLNGIDTFEISFGNVYFNYEDYVNIVFKLGDKIEIDYEKSKIKLEFVECDDKFLVIDEFVKNIYINRDILSSKDEWNREKVNNNIRKLLPNG